MSKDAQRVRLTIEEDGKKVIVREVDDYCIVPGKQIDIVLIGGSDDLLPKFSLYKAAPDLLEAAKAAVANLKQYTFRTHPSDECITMLEKAIAKTQGGE